MDTTSKHFRTSAAVLAAGGLCWIIKFVVIAATDGATSGLPDTVTAVLYLGAVALMALGLAGMGVTALRGRHPLLRAAAGLLGVVAWWASYMVIDTVAKSIAGDSGPSWLQDEAGIVATGAILMTVGLLLARPPLARIHSDVAATV